jgi:hypothetical protein
MSQSFKERLRSHDTAVRRQAIIALGQSGDRRALPLLADAYRSDPDPVLRDLARKAGMHLQRQIATPPAAASPGVVVDERYRSYMEAGYTPIAPEVAAPIRPVDDGRMALTDGYEVIDERAAAPQVSDADRRRAADLASSGIQAFERGNSAEAMRNIIAAMELNPALKHEALVQKVATGLTGQRGEVATEILADPRRRGLYVGQVKESAVQKAKRSGGVSWGDVLIDLGFLVIVAMVSAALSVWSTSRLITLVLPASELPPRWAELLASGLPFILIASLITGLYTAISALLVYTVVHVVAGFFGGSATLTQTLHALIPIQTVVGVASGVAVGVLLLTNSLELTGLLAMVVSVGSTIWQVRALARVQGFGWPSGCAVLVVGAIVFALLAWAISLIAGAALGGLVSTLPSMPGLLGVGLAL